MNFSTIISKVLKLFRKSNLNRIASMNEFCPPLNVKNMVDLNRKAFTKEISVPTIKVHKNEFPETLKKCKKILLKFQKFTSIRDSEHSDYKQILLNPTIIKSYVDLKDTGIEVDDKNFEQISVEIKYENWNAEQILRAVLPDNEDGCSGFSIIGHIAHFNLRDHLLPYKSLIGEVYLDKLPNVSMIVNKSDIIDNSDNTFRSFSMEKLAGTTSCTITAVKENKCCYKFDFSKVYWNPRLSTERERIIKKFSRNDAVFDVMAGVGPFVIPAAKIGCKVFANDLNPVSYEAMKENFSLNKIKSDYFCYNLDGNDFIKDIFHKNALDLSKHLTGTIHIIMNLPSIAVDFLQSFIGLYNIDEILNLKNKLLVHVYLFSYIESKEYATYIVASKMGYCCTELTLSENSKNVDTDIINSCIDSDFLHSIVDVYFVRKVAPAKCMYCVSFYVHVSTLVGDKNEKQPLKKIKLNL